MACKEGSFRDRNLRLANTGHHVIGRLGADGRDRLLAPGDPENADYRIGDCAISDPRFG